MALHDHRTLPALAECKLCNPPERSPVTHTHWWVRNSLGYDVCGDCGLPMENATWVQKRNRN